MLHKHLFKKYFVTSFLFLCGAVGGFFLLSLVMSTFQLKRIDISGGTIAEKKALTHFLVGKSTLFISPDEIKKMIQMQYPTLRIKESRISYPNSLILVIYSELPLAYLISDKGYIALSKAGIVIKKERTVTVPSPAITFYQPVFHTQYQTGEEIGFSAIKRALSFIDLLQTEGYIVEGVAIDSVDMIACKTKGFEVAFSQSRPLDLQVHELRQIIRQVRVGALRIQRLDLRFDKPVVQLPQKK